MTREEEGSDLGCLGILELSVELGLPMGEKKARASGWDICPFANDCKNAKDVYLFRNVCSEGSNVYIYCKNCDRGEKEKT